MQRDHDGAIERQAKHVLDLAFRLHAELFADDFSVSLAEAKRLWLSLLDDPQISRCAALCAHETAAEPLPPGSTPLSPSPRAGSAPDMVSVSNPPAIGNSNRAAQGVRFRPAGLFFS